MGVEWAVKGVMSMKIQVTWIVVMTVAAGGMLAAATAWAQEKEDVPARATWRPKAPERPELPPGVERQDDAFKVERPKANLPGLDSEEEEPAPGADAAVETAPAEAEVSTPSEVRPVEPEPEPDNAAQEPPPATQAETPDEPLMESRVETPQRPASVQATTAVEREPPSPIPGSVVQPEYPRDALLEGEEGYVALEFTVTRRGDVANVAITEAQPEGVFEEVVRQAIRRWEFEPATENGEPVDQRVRHRFDFNLDR